MEKTLYEKLVEAGVETDHHESDLYFKLSKESYEILKEYPTQFHNARRFINRQTKEVWIDVPFSYDPFWAKKGFSNG